MFNRIIAPRAGFCIGDGEACTRAIHLLQKTICNGMFSDILKTLW